MKPEGGRVSDEKNDDLGVYGVRRGPAVAIQARGRQAPGPGALEEGAGRVAETGAALALTAASLWLHAAFAEGAGAPWRDEIGTLFVANQPTLAELWRSIGMDSSGPLTHLAVRAWGALAGGSDGALRLGGFLTGAAGLAALWAAARALEARTPLLALLFVGLSPLAIRTGDSIRGYGLGSLLIMLYAAGLWRFIAGPDWKRWIAAAALAVAATQSLYLNLALVLALASAAGLAAVLNGRIRTAWSAAGTAALAAASLLPHLPQLRRAADWSVVSQVPASLSETLFAFVDGFGHPLFLAAWGLLAAVGMGAAAVRRLRGLDAGLRPASPPRRLLADYCAVGLPASLAGLIAALLLSRYPPHARYFVPFLGAACLLMQSLWDSWAGERRALRTATACLAGILAVLLFAPAREKVGWKMTNIDSVARRLEPLVVADDLIVVAPWYFGPTFRRHYRGRAPWTTLPPLEDLRTCRHDLLKEIMRTQDPIRPVLDRARASLRRGGRVWLVGRMLAAPGPRPPPPLEPAPHGGSGWLSAPYEERWGRQLAHFLASRSRRSGLVNVPGMRPVSRMEEAALGVFAGWRD